jgi:PAS domain S-box-containing protein
MPRALSGLGGGRARHPLFEGFRRYMRKFRPLAPPLLTMAVIASLEGGLLDQLPVGLVVADRRGTVARWNTVAEDLFGWSKTEVLGRKVFALARPNGDPSALRELIAQVSSGVSWEGELTLCDKTGTTLAVRLRASPICTRDDVVVGVVMVALDVAKAASTGAAIGAEIGARLAQARKQAGLTQKALAEGLGVTRRSIQGYEAGTVVPYKHLDRLGELLGRTPASLLGEKVQTVTADPIAQLRVTIHEELVAVFSELGASSEQLRRAELAAEHGVRAG